MKYFYVLLFMALVVVKGTKLPPVNFKVSTELNITLSKLPEFCGCFDTQDPSTQSVEKAKCEKLIKFTELYTWTRDICQNVVQPAAEQLKDSIQANSGTGSSPVYFKDSTALNNTLFKVPEFCACFDAQDPNTKSETANCKKLRDFTEAHSWTSDVCHNVVEPIDVELSQKMSLNSADKKKNDNNQNKSDLLIDHKTTEMPGKATNDTLMEYLRKDDFLHSAQLICNCEQNECAKKTLCVHDTDHQELELLKKNTILYSQAKKSCITRLKPLYDELCKKSSVSPTATTRNDNSQIKSNPSIHGTTEMPGKAATVAPTDSEAFVQSMKLICECEEIKCAKKSFCVNEADHKSLELLKKNTTLYSQAKASCNTHFKPIFEELCDKRSVTATTRNDNSQIKSDLPIHSTTEMPGKAATVALMDPDQFVRSMKLICECEENKCAKKTLCVNNTDHQSLELIKKDKKLYSAAKRSCITHYKSLYEVICEKNKNNNNNNNHTKTKTTSPDKTKPITAAPIDTHITSTASNKTLKSTTKTPTVNTKAPEGRTKPEMSVTERNSGTTNYQASKPFTVTEIVCAVVFSFAGGIIITLIIKIYMKR